MSENKKAVKGTSTITVDNLDGEVFTYVINPMNIDVYYAMNAMIRKNKTIEAYVMVIKSLKVEGDDPDILLKDDKYLPCLLALDGILGEMIQPCTANIKKN